MISWPEDPFYRDRGVMLPLVGGLAINLVLIAAYLFYIERSPYPLILHYSPYAGVDLLGEATDLYLIPFVGLALYAGDAWLAKFLYARIPWLGMMLAWCVLGFEVLLAVASVYLIRINR